MASKFPPSDFKIASTVLDRIEGFNYDEKIIKLLESQSPVALGRLGGTEARYLGNLIKLFTNYRKISKLHKGFSTIDLRRRRVEVNQNAGFFLKNPNDEMSFFDLYIDSLRNLDLLGVWGTAFAWPEIYGIENGKTSVIPLAALSPWVDKFPYEKITKGNIPWTNALVNKKVLVISPFSASIKKQFPIRNKCFQKVNLPKFELRTFTSPMTFAYDSTSDKSWFQILDNMIFEISKIDFEIALVGAGAYSLPLVSAIKKMGKKSIQTGGGTQLYFGIIGNRWENSSYVRQYLNEHWARPALDETPLNSGAIEGACYW